MTNLHYFEAKEAEPQPVVSCDGEQEVAANLLTMAASKKITRKEVREFYVAESVVTH